MTAKLNLQCDEKYFLLLKLNISYPFLSPNNRHPRFSIIINLKKSSVDLYYAYFLYI